MKVILIYVLIILILTGCSNCKNEEYKQIDFDVFYPVFNLFEDSNLNRCNILINIPVEDNVVYDFSKEIIICFKERNGKLIQPHIVSDLKKEKGVFLKARIIGTFTPKILSLVPSFSPIDVPNDLFAKVKYSQGHTDILTIKVKLNCEGFLEFIDVQNLRGKGEEPIRLK